MPRLPQPGQDAGNWGAILNDFLLQSHNDDGALKPNSVTENTIADNSVAITKLQNVGQADGLARLNNSGVLPDSQLPDRMSEDGLNNTIDSRIDTAARREAVYAEHEMKARLTSQRRRIIPLVQLGTIFPDSEAVGKAPFETDLGTATTTFVSGGPDTVTTSAAHGLVVGDKVRFAERTTSPFANGNAYYVHSIVNSTTFTVATSSGGNGVDLVSSGTGTVRVFKGVPFTFTTWNRSAGSITGVDSGDVSGDDVLISAAPHGLRVGDQIGFLASSIGGISNDTRYWVSEVISETKFRVSNSRARSSIVELTSSGTATLTKSDSRLTTLRYPLMQRTFTFPGYFQGTADTAAISVGAGVASGSDPERRFIFRGNQLLLRIFRSGSGRTTIAIDGIRWRTITDAQLNAVGISAGSAGFVAIVFPDDRPRRIDIIGSNFYGLYVSDLNHVVTAPVPVSQRVVWVGDSFTEGTGANGGGDEGFAGLASRIIGVEDYLIMGAGSTGYESDGTRLKWREHWQDAVNVLPDVLVWSLGINDAAIAPSTVLQSAITCWDGVATALPATRQVIIGPWPNNGGGGGTIQNLVTLDALLEEAAQARGYQYLSPIQDGVTFTRSDSTHPDQAGHDALGVWVAARLQKLF